MRGFFAFSCVVLSACPRFAVEVQPNAVPVAVAAVAEQDVAAGSTVILDGADSTDADGDALTFRWSQVQDGAEPVAIKDANESAASFTAPLNNGSLFFQLVVNDGIDDSVPLVVRVNVSVAANGAPTALATESLSATTGEQVVLDGSGSSDPDGAALSFSWTRLDLEGGDPVNLADADTAIARFTAPDTAQRLFFQLVVNDGVLDSLPFVVRVDVTPPPNTAPVAAAEDDVVAVDVGDTVVLDGSASVDDDEDALTFLWTQVEGEGDPVNLGDATQAVVSFQAPLVADSLFFRLVVNDGTVDSLPFVVRVDVRVPPNLPPDVVVNDDAVVVDTGDTVVMDASESVDPEGAALVYRWEQVENGALPVNLAGATSAVASFRAPDEAGRLFFRLVISDGENSAPPFVVQVDVVAPPPNTAPTALAGVNLLQVRSGESVILDGDASFDPEDDDVAGFQWTLLDGPDNGLALFSPPTADVVDPAVQLIGRGSYFFSLVVVDDDGAASPPATVRVDVLNNPPVANAGLDTTTDNNTPITVVGVANDVDGDELRFAWTLVDFPDGGRVSLTNPDQPAVRFTPTKKTRVTDPAQCEDGDCYVLQLVVSDGRESSIADTVVITSLNRAPVADAGVDSDDIDGRVVLDGTGSSDPDDDAIATFTWTQVAGPQIAGGPTFAGAAQDLVPPSTGVFTFELIVNDGAVDSAPDRVSVTVGDVNDPPVLTVAQTRFVVAEGAAETLSATATDINGDIVTVIWRLVAGSTRFPQQLVGEDAEIVAPAYLELLDDPNGNRAVYAVSASDGEAESGFQLVEVFVGPGAGFVIVSTAPGATANPGCGALATPCSTFASAVLSLDPDADGIGDGRDIILVADTFPLAGAVVPARTSILGGRDRETFAVVGNTDLVQVGNFIPQRAVLFFGTSAQDALVERINLHAERPFSSATGNLDGIICSGCSIELRDARIDMAGIDFIAAVNVAGAANVELTRLVIDVDATVQTRGLLLAGGNVTVSEVDMRVDTGGVTIGVDARGAIIDMDRSRIRITGAGSNDDEIGVALSAGVISLTNTQVAMTSPGGQSAVVINGGTGSFFYNSFVSPGGNVNTGGIEASAPFVAHGNIIQGFNFVFFFVNNAPRTSRIYNNALDPASTQITCPNVPSAEVNSIANTGCNFSSEAWTGNVVAACPVVDPVGGDLHLNTQLDNPCVDASTPSSPAGVGPLFDVDGDDRDATPDIGADEI